MNKALSIENKSGFGTHKVTGSKFQERKGDNTHVIFDLRPAQKRVRKNTSRAQKPASSARFFTQLIAGSTQDVTHTD
jgi:hypothetical protein